MNQDSMFLIYFLCLVFNIFSIGIGKLFLSSSAPDMNYVIGFRTKLSTKNNENWKFANELYGKYLLRAGIVNLILTIAFIIIDRGLSPELSKGIATTIAMLTAILPVIIALPVHFKLKTFDKQSGTNKSF